MTRRRQAYLLLREAGVWAAMVLCAAPYVTDDEGSESYDQAFAEVHDRFKAIWRPEEPKYDEASVR